MNFVLISWLSTENGYKSIGGETINEQLQSTIISQKKCCLHPNLHVQSGGNSADMMHTLLSRKLKYTIPYSGLFLRVFIFAVFTQKYTEMICGFNFCGDRQLINSKIYKGNKSDKNDLE